MIDNNMNHQNDSYINKSLSRKIFEDDFASKNYFNHELNLHLKNEETNKKSSNDKYFIKNNFGSINKK